MNKLLENPGLAHKLLPFQDEGVRFLERRNGRAILADEMGLGKTVQAIAYLVRNERDTLPALVVCPASLRVNWIREIKKFTDLDAFVLASKSQLRAFRRLGVPVSDKMEPAHVCVTNYDILGRVMPMLESAGFRTLILDEAHYIKDSKSQRTRFSLELAQRVDHAILLTGTPVLNRPCELWTLTQAVDPGMFPSWWRFAFRYCDAKKKKIYIRGGRGEQREVWDFSGASNLGELERRMREIMIRRKKEDVLQELPPRVRVTVPVVIESAEYDEIAKDVREKLRRLQQERERVRTMLEGMSPEERKAYFAEHVGEAASSARLRGLVISEIERLRIACAIGKIPHILERIRDMSEESPIVVFTHHHSVTDSILEGLAEQKIEHVRIDGRDDAATRQQAIDRFQAGGARVAVLGILAGGVGLTLTAASNVLFAELPWRPVDVDQAEARVWRYGQKNSVTSWFLVAMGTIDEKIAEILDIKRGIVSAVVGEGERAVSEEGILESILEGILEE